MQRSMLGGALLTATLVFTGQAQAMLIVSNLGNVSTGVANGTFLTTPQIAAIQNGQPAPFDQGYGSDLFGNQAFSQGYTHTYGVIADPILAATLTIGIADHDSDATGSQLSQLLVDGFNATTPMDSAFEADSGHENGTGTEFNIYQIDLLAAGVSTAALADGSAPVQLDLQGPSLVWNLLLQQRQERPGNGAFLISSTLAITTVPEPSSFVFLMIVALGATGYRWRRRNKEAAEA